MNDKPLSLAERMRKPYPQELKAFGSNWCGPEIYPDRQPVLVAKYTPEPGSDGQPVEVYCECIGARFYTLEMLEAKNSIGETEAAWTLATGSGAHELTAQIARAICNGMLGLGKQ